MASSALKIILLRKKIEVGLWVFTLTCFAFLPLNYSIYSFSQYKFCFTSFPSRLCWRTVKFGQTAPTPEPVHPQIASVEEHLKATLHSAWTKRPWKMMSQRQTIIRMMTICRRFIRATIKRTERMRPAKDIIQVVYTWNWEALVSEV